jgi:hypothetical protein
LSFALAAISAPAHAHVLILRPAGHARDQIGECVAVEQRVGVDGHDQQRGHADERRVERVVLAGRRLEAAPVVDAESLRRGLGQLGRSVGRVVVGQHDLNGTWIVGRSDVLDRPLDRRLLVERGDNDGDRGPLALAPRSRGRVELRRPIAREQQREAQEADHDRRDVREHDRDQPRRHRPDRFLQLRAPGLRDPHRERDPGDGCRRGERESQRRPQAERGPGPGGERPERFGLRSDRAHTAIVPCLAAASIRGGRLRRR